MGNTFIKVIRYLLPVALLSCAGGQPPAKNLSSTILYMDQPAASWYEATPIGNGRFWKSRGSLCVPMVAR